ncbi:MAG: DNA replication/repair protein RecF [Oscillospiraceae bacterium]|jgi:DNA replication and repair protein RecF|nr:DNA replication/repair protein RecF [Oscillospiraceae bacterium]
MKINTFQAENFRNLKSVSLEPCPNVNVIYGGNGQGKTSLAEALWLFSGCKSFRTSSNGEMIQYGQTNSTLKVQFEAAARLQHAELTVTPKGRELTLGGFREPTPRRLLGVFPVVCFTPQALSLAQGGPAERRNFLNVALSMVSPSYAVTLAKYLKALAQRQALLKTAFKTGCIAADMFSVWEEKLSLYATDLILFRRKYLSAFLPLLQEYYEGISGGKEALTAKMKTPGLSEDAALCADANAVSQAYRNAMQTCRQTDVFRQLTSTGPHRDDLELFLNGKPLRDFGSQGQQRSVALAMKFAEADTLMRFTDEIPIAVLDDVLGELDADRQKGLLSFIRERQVFLTTCEPSHALHGQSGKVFCVREGQVCSA